MRRMLLGLLLFTGCAPSPSTSTTTVPDKYTQTWPKNYAQTTCEEWSESMSESQRFAAAADMLVGARSKDGGSGLPSDALVIQFAGDVSEACSAEVGLSLAEAGAATYLVGGGQYSP